MRKKPTKEEMDKKIAIADEVMEEILQEVIKEERMYDLFLDWDMWAFSQGFWETWRNNQSDA